MAASSNYMYMNMLFKTLTTYHTFVVFIFQTASGIQTVGVAVDWIQFFVYDTYVANSNPTSR